MNILLISRIIARTGVGNHIKQLSEELSHQGHRVFVISSTNDLDIGKTGSIVFKQIELRSKNPIVVWKSINKIHSFIECNKIEIVHCHHRVAALYMDFYNKIWNVPYVYTLHSAPIPSDFFHRKLTKIGSAAIAISKEVGAFLHERLQIPESCICYVLNGVDESHLFPVTNSEKEKLRIKFGIDTQRTVIAMHSRIDAVKNHISVLEAIQKLTADEQEKLVILCSGERSGEYYNLLLKKIDEVGLESCFIFCGWVETREIIGAADALLLPSVKEGFALSCIEAMFVNVPVTRSKTGGYEDTKNYLVGLEDISPDTIAEHIRKIINGTEYRSEQTLQAKVFVEKNCTVNAMAKNTVAVYQKVLNLEELR